MFHTLFDANHEGVFSLVRDKNNLKQTIHSMKLSNKAFNNNVIT